jgi:hypothetical protein
MPRRRAHAPRANGGASSAAHRHAFHVSSVPARGTEARVSARVWARIAGGRRGATRHRLHVAMPLELEIGLLQGSLCVSVVRLRGVCCASGSPVLVIRSEVPAQSPGHFPWTRLGPTSICDSAPAIRLSSSWKLAETEHNTMAPLDQCAKRTSPR